MFLIRDGGKVFNKVSVPTVIYDKESDVILKIGEYDILKDYMVIIQNELKNTDLIGYLKEVSESMINNMILFELPRDQEEIDKIFQITGYLGNNYKDYFN